MNYQTGKRYERDESLPPAGTGLLMPCTPGEWVDVEVHHRAGNGKLSETPAPCSGD